MVLGEFGLICGRQDLLQPGYLELVHRFGQKTTRYWAKRTWPNFVDVVFTREVAFPVRMAHI